MRHFPHRRRASHLAALFVGLLFALSGVQAHAQRAARSAKAKPTVAGAKVKSWKANGTKFQHETLKMGGKVVHWERASTGKKGSTKINGKTWGSSYKGNQWKSGNKMLRKVRVKGTDGSKREVFSITEKSGTKRTTIKGIPGVATRRITTWKVGNTQMTSTRDYGKDGKVTAQSRSGQKAK